MLLMVEKCIRGGICHYLHYRYPKANSKFMKNFDKSKKSSYIQYWDVNNLDDWAILQKLPVNNFEWIKDTQFNEDFIENYNEESDKGYFLEVDVEYLEKLHDLHKNLPFLSEKMKIEKIEKLVANLHDKLNMLST